MSASPFWNCLPLSLSPPPPFPSSFRPVTLKEEDPLSFFLLNGSSSPTSPLPPSCTTQTWCAPQSRPPPPPPQVIAADAPRDPNPGAYAGFWFEGGLELWGGLKTLFTGPYVVKFLTIFLFIEYKIVKVKIFWGGLSPPSPPLRTPLQPSSVIPSPPPSSLGRLSSSMACMGLLRAYGLTYPREKEEKKREMIPGYRKCCTQPATLRPLAPTSYANLIQWPVERPVGHPTRGDRGNPPPSEYLRRRFSPAPSSSSPPATTKNRKGGGSSPDAPQRISHSGGKKEGGGISLQGEDGGTRHS